MADVRLRCAARRRGAGMIQAPSSPGLFAAGWGAVRSLATPIPYAASERSIICDCAMSVAAALLLRISRGTIDFLSRRRVQDGVALAEEPVLLDLIYPGVIDI